jgi:hypothetical protein
LQDARFVKELNKEKEKGVPTLEDWYYARSVLPFLKLFYDCTLHLSGTSYVTSNMYMKEVFAIGRKINQYCDHSDLSIKLMAMKMMKKYEKYWGNSHTLNMLLLIDVVIDPRNKLVYINW